MKNIPAPSLVRGDKIPGVGTVTGVTTMAGGLAVSVKLDADSVNGIVANLMFRPAYVGASASDTGGYAYPLVTVED